MAKTNEDARARQVWDLVDASKNALEELSDKVWDTPELAYDEHRSVAAHIAAMEAQGFRVTKDVAGTETAVMGEAGEGGPVIAILGEYDALPGLSQHSGDSHHHPVVPSGHGHGCGHNLLGAGSLLAATAVKDYIAANKIKARLQSALQMKELMLEGVIGIVEGLNPKLIRTKLDAYIQQPAAPKKAKNAKDEHPAPVGEEAEAKT